jgi:hypothetical protein
MKHGKVQLMAQHLHGGQCTLGSSSSCGLALGQYRKYEQAQRTSAKSGSIMSVRGRRYRKV